MISPLWGGFESHPRTLRIACMRTRALAEIERKYIGHLSDKGQIEEEEKEIADAMREYFLKKDHTGQTRV